MFLKVLRKINKQKQNVPNFISHSIPLQLNMADLVGLFSVVHAVVVKFVYKFVCYCVCVYVLYTVCVSDVLFVFFGSCSFIRSLSEFFPTCTIKKPHTVLISYLEYFSQTVCHRGCQSLYFYASLSLLRFLALFKFSAVALFVFCFYFGITAVWY